MEEDFHERFLKANANPDYMASVLADMLRNAMRASMADDYYSSQIYEGAKNLKFLFELLLRAEEFNFKEIFEKAIKELEGDPPAYERQYEYAIFEAAVSGMKYFAERSCVDNAAKARTSKKRDNFLDDIKRIDRAREEMIAARR